MASWIWGTSQFDEEVDKATSELTIVGTEDMALNLEICDQIRSKSVGANQAMKSLKRRLNHQNPNVVLLALSLLDLCVKNGGDHFLVEIASREFMDNLASIVKVPSVNRDVREKILRLIQNWALSFEGKSSLSYVETVYKTLQKEGFVFPPKDLSAVGSAMVDTSTAPEWIDSDVCMRCRTPFTFTNRKHHCRNCGQVFDQSCSSKTLPLPHFGITQPVRVCDSCFFKLQRKKVSDRPPSVDLKHSRSLSHSHSASSGRLRKSARQQADEDLQRAIALSLEESRTQNPRPGYVPATSSSWPGASEPPLVSQSGRTLAEEEEDDPELRAAIEASLREANLPRASAPEEYPGPSSSQLEQDDPGYDLNIQEEDAILTFSQTIETAHSRGTRDLARYPGVTELRDRAINLQPKLAVSLDDTLRKEQELTDMHEKLSEVVRLYDRILTEQLNPARRYSSYNTYQSRLPPQNAAFAPSPPVSAPYPSQTAAPTQWGPPVASHGYEESYARSQAEPTPQQYAYNQPAQTPVPSTQYYAPQPTAPATISSPSPMMTATSGSIMASVPPAPPMQSPTASFSNVPPSPEVQTRPVLYNAPPPPATPQRQNSYQASVPIAQQQQQQRNPYMVAPPPGQPMHVTSPPPQPVLSPPPPAQPQPVAPISMFNAPSVPSQPPSFSHPQTALPSFPSVPTEDPHLAYHYSNPVPTEAPKEAMLISFD